MCCTSATSLWVAWRSSTATPRDQPRGWSGRPCRRPVPGLYWWRPHPLGDLPDDMAVHEVVVDFGGRMCIVTKKHDSVMYSGVVLAVPRVGRTDRHPRRHGPRQVVGHQDVTPSGRRDLDRVLRSIDMPAAVVILVGDDGELLTAAKGIDNPEALFDVCWSVARQVAAEIYEACPAEKQREARSGPADRRGRPPPGHREPACTMSTRSALAAGSCCGRCWAGWPGWVSC